MQKNRYYLFGIALTLLVLLILGNDYIRRDNAITVALLTMADETIGAIEEVACGVFFEGKDQDHCFQDAAIRQGDASVCEKIKGETFSKLAGNPPRDKCYMLIAVKKKDITLCGKIKGGLISYTPKMCLEKVAMGALAGKK